MQSARVIALTLVLSLATSSLLLAAPAAAKPAKPAKVKNYKAGELFCPAGVLVFGNIVVQSGRCYVLFVLRESRGTFLAFAAPDAKLPPGQLVRLHTPAGAKLRGRIFYLVPMRTTAAFVPMDSVMLVAVRADDFGPQLSLTIVGTPSPNLTVIFNVRL